MGSRVKNLKNFWESVSVKDPVFVKDANSAKDKVLERSVSGNGIVTLLDKNEENIEIERGCCNLQLSVGMSTDEQKPLTNREQERKNREQELKKMAESLEAIQTDPWACHGYVHVRSEPVFEVLSVNLRNKSNTLSHSSNQSWELYGNIDVYDASERSNRYILFERTEQDEPELIPFVGGTLSLTGPDDIMSMDKPTVLVNILDKVSGKNLIFGAAPLLKTTDIVKQDHQFEQFRSITLSGTGCSAEVEYLALTFGMFAQVEVRLFKSRFVGSESDEEEEVEEGEGEELDVYGKISAEYKLYGSEKQVHSVTLFEIKKGSNKLGQVILGSPISLSRSVVAVPAYSTLTISVEVWDGAKNEIVFGGSCEFETNNHSREQDIIRGPDCLHAQVFTEWREPFMLDKSYNKMDRLGLNNVRHFSIPVCFFFTCAFSFFLVFDDVLFSALN